MMQAQEDLKCNNTLETKNTGKNNDENKDRCSGQASGGQGTQSRGLSSSEQPAKAESLSVESPRKQGNTDPSPALSGNTTQLRRPIQAGNGPAKDTDSFCTSASSTHLESVQPVSHPPGAEYSFVDQTPRLELSHDRNVLPENPNEDSRLKSRRGPCERGACIELCSASHGAASDSGATVVEDSPNVACSNPSCYSSRRRSLKTLGGNPLAQESSAACQIAASGREAQNCPDAYSGDVGPPVQRAVLDCSKGGSSVHEGFDPGGGEGARAKEGKPPLQEGEIVAAANDDSSNGQDIDLASNRQTCRHCRLRSSGLEVMLTCGHWNVCVSCFFCQDFLRHCLEAGTTHFCLTCSRPYSEVRMARLPALMFSRNYRCRRCGCNGHKGG